MGKNAISKMMERISIKADGKMLLGPKINHMPSKSHVIVLLNTEESRYLDPRITPTFCYLQLEARRAILESSETFQSG